MRVLNSYRYKYNRGERKRGNDMSQLDILRESLGQCDEILLDALLMRNRIGRGYYGIQRGQ